MFEDLPWDEAFLVGLFIDRSKPGEKDQVYIDVAWGTGGRSRLLFSNCYQCVLCMGFGVVSEEKVLSVDQCFVKDKDVDFIEKWRRIGVDLDSLLCFSLVTEATYGKIVIYAMELSVVDVAY